MWPLLVFCGFSFRGVFSPPWRGGGVFFVSDPPFFHPTPGGPLVGVEDFFPRAIAFPCQLSSFPRSWAAGSRLLGARFFSVSLALSRGGKFWLVSSFGVNLLVWCPLPPPFGPFPRRRCFSVAYMSLRRSAFPPTLSPHRSLCDPPPSR